MLISRASLTLALSFTIPALAFCVIFLGPPSGDVNLLSVCNHAIFMIAATVYGRSLLKGPTSLSGIVMLLLIPFGDGGENAITYAIWSLFMLQDHFFDLIRASIGA